MAAVGRHRHPARRIACSRHLVPHGRRRRRAPQCRRRRARLRARCARAAHARGLRTPARGLSFADG